jgi:hypothetical protein
LYIDMEAFLFWFENQRVAICANFLRFDFNTPIRPHN